MAARKAINRANFSSPILSEAIVHNGLVFCSGKVGMDANSGVLVSDDVAEQTKAALGLLGSVLRAAGSDLSKMLKVTIYLTDINDFAAMNGVYTATVPDPKPARVCVTVTELGRGAKVEIDCVATTEIKSSP